MPPTGVIRHFIPRISRRGNGLSTREYHFAAMKRRRGAALEAVSFERCVMSCATQMFGAQRPGMWRFEQDQIRLAADRDRPGIESGVARRTERQPFGGGQRREQRLVHARER